MQLVIIIQLTVFLNLLTRAADTNTCKRAIEYGDKNQCQNGRYRQTANYGNTQRTPHLGTFTLPYKSDITFKLVPVKNNAINTPLNANGMENMMMNG